jgi:hypothetical protein
MVTFDAINQRRAVKVKPAMPKGGQLPLSEVVVQNRFA